MARHSKSCSKIKNGLEAMIKRQQNPPQFFLDFFRWFCKPRLRDHIEGDLREIHGERIKEIGKRKADIKFIIDVLLLFRPGIIRTSFKQPRLNYYAMYK